MTTNPPRDEIDLLKLGLDNYRHLGLFHSNPDKPVRWLNNFRTAHVFRFDAAASEQAAIFSVKYFDVLVRLLPEIRLPFDRCILQLDNRAIVHAVASASDEPERVLRVPRDEEMTPFRTFLLWSTGSTSFRAQPLAYIDRTQHSDAPLCIIAPIAFNFDAEPSSDVILATPGDSLMFKASGEGLSPEFRHGDLSNIENVVDLEYYGEKKFMTAMHLLGGVSSGTYQDDEFFPVFPAATRENLRLFTKHTGIGMSPLTDFNWEAPHRWDGLCSFLQENVGDLRVVLAALAMLVLKMHQVATVSEPFRPAGKLRSGKLQVPYFSERTVTIRLPEKRLRQALLANARAHETIRRRRHPVRGHWAQRGGNPRCVHRLEALDANHSECKLCGCKQFFRRGHERGDASLGYVIRPGFSVTTKEKG
jgi:hypothetical protein